MKSVFAGVVLLFAVSVVCSTEPCSKPTDEEMNCFISKGSQDVVTHCKGVDFSTLEKGDIQGSNLCKVPECITTLGKDIYTPCHRSDLTACIRTDCSKVHPTVECPDVTSDQMKCFVDTGTKNADAIGMHCKGVDFELLEKKEIKESKICEHPDCIATLEKVMYAPCNRSDLGSCIQKDCNSSMVCPPVTDAQTKCMTDAGSKNSTDVLMHCKGVNFDDLKNGDLNGSKLCDHPECITALNKDIYTPCNRSDLAGCIRNACTGASNCSAPSTDELKCMTEEGTKNAADIQTHCTGVDFDALKNGDLKGSKLCDHPACITELDKDVYTPCKRHDLTGCIQMGCKM